MKVPNGRIAMHGVVSTITHQVLSDTDEVTLACWATNRIGKQQRPCLTHVIPASNYYATLKLHFEEVASGKS